MTAARPFMVEGTAAKFQVVGEGVIIITRTAHSTALIVRGTAYNDNTTVMFQVVGADFMPLLRQQGVAHGDIPAWVRELATDYTPW